MKKKFKIGFYALQVSPTPTVTDVSAGFAAFADGTYPTSLECDGYTRELYSLDHRPKQKTCAGQLRKFRVENLPEIGALGEAAEQIALADGEGLIEANVFVLFLDYGVLGWLVNGHANSPRQLQRFLSDSWGTKVSLDPIIQPDAVKQLMRDDVEMKTWEVTVARPTNPDVYPSDDFSKDLITMMAGTGADSLKLRFGVHARRKDSAGKLKAGLKSTLRAIADFGASTARTYVYDGEDFEVIDLITSRVSSLQEVEFNGNNPPVTALISAIYQARRDCEGAIRGYFGHMGDALD